MMNPPPAFPRGRMFSHSPLFAQFPCLGDEVPDRDRALRMDWRAGQEVLDKLRITPTNASEGDIIRRLVLDLLHADFAYASNHGPRSISYSRHAPRYKGMTRYYGSCFNLRSVTGAVDRLRDGGFLIERRARSSGPRGARGRQSTITARGKLVEIAAEDFTAEYVPGELIRLKDSDKRLIPYKDDKNTSRFRHEMRITNEALASAKIDLPDAMFGSQVIIKDKIDGAWRVRLQIPANTLLYRVFNRGAWNRGGRLYGPWWQKLPKRDRARLLIDGEPTSEIDYSSFHPQIIFAKHGIPFEFDPYDVAGATRDEAKLAILIALNAKSRTTAVGALAKKLAEAHDEYRDLDDEDDDYDYDDYKEGGDGPLDPAAKARAKQVLDTVIEQSHNVLADAFFTDRGVELMAEDSRLIVDVLLAAARHGIVGLPIHDSIVARQRDTDRVRELMVKHFHMRFRKAVTPCKTKRIPSGEPHNEESLPIRFVANGAK
jgi:hypothetical protein